MGQRVFERIAAACAMAVAGLSIVYAIAYLGIAPAALRGSNVDRFFASYLAHPAGMRVASTCLLLSGLLVGVAVVGLVGRLASAGVGERAWVSIVGVVGGLATAAHGLQNLVGVDKLAHRYQTGDAATRAAVAVVHVSPSAVDPRGLATFCIAGLVALVLGSALRPAHPALGPIGMILGIDMVALFLATATGVNALVLITGGLASIIVGPVWWFGVGRLLWASTPDEPNQFVNGRSRRTYAEL